MSSVLIVDDEDVLLDLVASIIEDLGHRPLLATNGRDALSVLEAERDLPALIISDVMMPQMNGVALAHHLKRDPRYQSVPLVLMSAAGPHHPDGLADRFIHKPFDIDELEQLIQDYSGA
jgi:CheY-like chemotaxis protein